MSQQVSQVARVEFLSGIPANELKLKIARLITTPQTTRRPASLGFPNIPDLDDTLRAVNQDTRDLFCDIVCKDYLHIQVAVCECGWKPSSPAFFSILTEHLQHRRRVPDISIYQENLRLNLSILEIGIICDTQCRERQAQIKTFLASRESTLTLYGTLQNLLPETWTLRVDVRCANPRTTAKAVKVLDEMRAIMYQTTIHPQSMLPPGYDAAGFRADLARRLLTAKDMVLSQEAYLCAIQDAMDDGVPLEQLVSSLVFYESKTTSDTMDFFELEALYGIRNWSLTRRYLFEFEMTYDCAVLQGVASYLLSRDLIYEEQFHFVWSPRDGMQISSLWQILFDIDRSIRFFGEFEENLATMNMPMPVTMGWMAPIFKARIEFLLAWARFRTLGNNEIQYYPYTEQPPVEDVESDGDNADEDVYHSTWGTPKTILIMVRRDLGRLDRWVAEAQLHPTQEMREGVHPMNIGENLAWLRDMRELVDAVDDAQPGRATDRVVAREHLARPLVLPGGLCTRLMYLPDRAGREAMHAGCEVEGWVD